MSEEVVGEILLFALLAKKLAYVKFKRFRNSRRFL